MPWYVKSVTLILILALLGINPTSGFIYGGTSVYVTFNYLIPSTVTANYTCRYLPHSPLFLTPQASVAQLFQEPN
jgi:hypothetical protein